MQESIRMNHCIFRGSNFRNLYILKSNDYVALKCWILKKGQILKSRTCFNIYGLVLFLL